MNKFWIWLEINHNQTFNYNFRKGYPLDHGRMCKHMKIGFMIDYLMMYHVDFKTCKNCIYLKNSYLEIYDLLKSKIEEIK